VKEYQEKDKIRSKPDKTEKRGEAGKSQKQLQWIKEVKLKKTQKEGPEMQIIQVLKEERKKQGLDLQFIESYKEGGPSTPPSYSSRPSTLLSYSSGSSTPINYSLGSSKNAECSNYKHLRGKISVLKVTMDMHMHPEQHTVNSAALLHEVLKEMENLIWSSLSCAV
nr:hypothetical protein [Tanacetum cinerariifolium]